MTYIYQRPISLSIYLPCLTFATVTSATSVITFTNLRRHLYYLIASASASQLSLPFYPSSASYASRYVPFYLFIY